MIRDCCVQGVVQRRVDQVRVGDFVDLEGDPFADPDVSEEFAFEYARVDEIAHEPHDTDPCIVLHTSQGSFGFPPDHYIEVDPEQVRTAEASDDGETT